MNHKVSLFEILSGIWVLGVMFGFLYFTLTSPDEQANLDNASFDASNFYKGVDRGCMVGCLHSARLEHNLSEDALFEDFENTSFPECSQWCHEAAEIILEQIEIEANNERGLIEYE